MRAAWEDLALIVLVGFVLPLAAMAIVGLWQGATGAEPDFVSVLMFVKWLDAVLVSGLLAYLVLRRGLSLRSLGLRCDRMGAQLLWTGGALLLTYAWVLVTMLIVGIVLYLLPELEKDVLRRQDVLNLMPVHDLGRTLALLVPVAVHEELVFRGLLLPYLRRALGSWWPAVLLSCGIFAVLHVEQGWVGVLQILGVGVVWSLFFVITRSLLVTVAAHFLFNLLQFQMVRLLPRIDVAWQGVLGWLG